MKKVKSYRLDEKTIKGIEELSIETGATQGKIIDDAISIYIYNRAICKENIDKLEEKISILKDKIELLESERKSLEKIEELYNEIIMNKNKEILELKKEIEQLKEKLEKKGKGLFKW